MIAMHLSITAGRLCLFERDKREIFEKSDFVIYACTLLNFKCYQWNLFWKNALLNTLSCKFVSILVCF